MKKVIFSLSVIGFGLAFASCKKYTCSCYDSNTGASSTVTVSSPTAVGAISKCSQKSSGSTTCSY